MTHRSSIGCRRGWHPSTPRCARGAARAAWSSCRRERSSAGTSPPAETQAYEERLLCLLLMLRDPDLRVVYVTSSPVRRAIVEYYLSLLGPELRRRRPRTADAAHRRRRVRAPAVREAARAPAPARPASAGRSATRALPPRPLRHDRARARPRRRARHPGLRRRSRARLPRDQERRRASCSRAPASRTRWASSTSPARRRAIEAIARLRAARPELAAGGGQARRRRLRRGQRDRRARAGCPRPARATSGSASAERFDAMPLEAPGVPRRRVYLRARWRAAASSRSGSSGRSCAARASSSSSRPAATRGSSRRTIRSSSGQRYLGCRFPAEPAYARADHARSRGGSAQLLAAAGRRGRAGIDFVVARDADGGWQAVRDRGQPAQRRDDAPAGGARAADRRRLRRPTRRLHDARAARRGTTSRPTTSSRPRAAGARPRRPARG